MLCLDMGWMSFMQKRRYFWITKSCPTRLVFALSVRGAGCWEQNWQGFPVLGGHWFLSLKQLSQFRFIFQISLKERERAEYQMRIFKISSIAVQTDINKWTLFPPLVFAEWSVFAWRKSRNGLGSGTSVLQLLPVVTVSCASMFYC